MPRKIKDKTYLSYLLVSLNIKELKEICRDFEIKGYSKLKKSELIEFILDSLSEEELKELLKLKELEIISKEIDLAIKKIDGEDRESLESIKVVNLDNHEIELSFRGWNWEVTSFLSMRDDNIHNPERDCDCKIGSNMGFCSHFWIGFIFSLKENYFKLKDWNLTVLPKDFQKRIESIGLTSSIGTEKNGKELGTIKLIDKSSGDFQYLDLVEKSITVYEGEITEIEKKQQIFQEYETIYFLIELKNVKVGPRIKKKSEFREEDVKEIKKFLLRISEKLYDESNIKKGDKLSVNGKLTKDNFLKIYIVKNIRKIQKI
ncbi:MAG: Rho termination factor N-terminal domain-containing protein [Candidatus Hermodarchaeota archaeon]